MGHLPVELWAEVFVSLKRLYYPCETDMEDSDSRKFVWRHKSQAMFCQLPLVCKRFLEAFSQHSELPGSVYLEKFPASKQESFSAWATNYAAGVQLLELTEIGQKQLTECLKIMADSAPNLHSANLELAADVRSLEALGALHSIQRCEIHGEGPNHPVNLESLSTLQNLQELCLKGAVFHDIQLASSVQRLDLGWCYCFFVGACPFISRLQHLEIQDSRALALGMRGISDCTALRQLMLHESTVIGTDQYIVFNQDDEPFEQKGYHIDQHITALTQLNTLTIDMHGSLPEEYDWPWLYQLTTLTCLELILMPNVELGNLTQLSRLCELSITGCVDDDDGVAYEVKLDISWGSMHSLQRLSISAGALVIGLDFLSLLDMPCLKDVSFTCQMADQSSSSVFSIFLYRLARLRPDIKLFIGRVPDVLADKLLLDIDDLS